MLQDGSPRWGQQGGDKCPFSCPSPVQENDGGADFVAARLRLPVLIYLLYGLNIKPEERSGLGCHPGRPLSETSALWGQTSLLLETLQGPRAFPMPQPLSKGYSSAGARGLIIDGLGTFSADFSPSPSKATCAPQKLAPAAPALRRINAIHRALEPGFVKSTSARLQDCPGDQLRAWGFGVFHFVLFLVLELKLIV